MDRIVFKVAEAYGYTPERLRSRRRDRDLTYARHVGFFIAREATTATTPQIAKAFGRADHTTVLHGLKRAEDFIAGNPGTEALAYQIIAEVTA